MGNEQWTMTGPSELPTRVSLARLVSWLHIDLTSLWTLPEGIHPVYSPHCLQVEEMKEHSVRVSTLSRLNREGQVTVSGFLGHMPHSIAYSEPYSCQDWPAAVKTLLAQILDKLGRFSISTPASPKLSPNYLRRSLMGPSRAGLTPILVLPHLLT